MFCLIWEPNSQAAAISSGYITRPNEAIIKYEIPSHKFTSETKESILLFQTFETRFLSKQHSISLYLVLVMCALSITLAFGRQCTAPTSANGTSRQSYINHFTTAVAHPYYKNITCNSNVIKFKLVSIYLWALFLLVRIFLGVRMTYRVYLYFDLFLVFLRRI